MKHLPLIILCVLAFFFLKKRFFDNTDYKAMLNNGGIIVDVRSSGEFFGGHIDGSLNIPLGEITDKLDYLKDKNQHNYYVLCIRNEKCSSNKIA